MKMKTRSKPVIAIVLIAVLALSVAACNNGDSGTSPGSSPANSPASSPGNSAANSPDVSQEIYDVVWLVHGPQATTREDSFTVAVMEEKYGLNIELITYTGAENEQFNLWWATGNQADYTFCGGPLVYKLDGTGHVQVDRLRFL